MEAGYIKADSANLPKVDSYMIGHFFANNLDFCSAEFRNVKTSLSARDSYGDSAIGYVQLKREGTSCTVKCKVCPEHKVSQRSYSVSMIVEEKEGLVKSVQCHDCPASLGGCKHSVAFLMWVHRRSEEPGCTSKECYWKKSKLSRVGSTLKFMTVDDMTGKKSISITNTQDDDDDNTVLLEFIKQAKEKQIQTCQILKHLPGYHAEETQLLSLHHLSTIYNKDNDYNKFLNEISKFFTPTNIKLAELHTRKQYENSLWHELRYGRITASKAFDVSRCKTPDGSLTAAIMGARLPDTPALKRGRKLEAQVHNVLEKRMGKITECGLFISEKYPVLAGSPDGILNETSVVEIKCPTSQKTSFNYIDKNGQITAKYFAQIQMQMYVTGLKKGIFCVADSSFEENNEVKVVKVEFDKNFVLDIIKNLIVFWKNNIYPLL